MFWNYSDFKRENNDKLQKLSQPITLNVGEQTIYYFEKSITFGAGVVMAQW